MVSVNDKRSAAIQPIPLFLHIPKCGGTTITHVIYQQCHSASREPRRSKYWHRGVYFYPAGLFSKPSAPSNPEVARMLSRADLRAVVGHFAFGIHQHVPAPSLYVTALRNPVSRILSLYDELRVHNHLDMTLEQFVLNPPYNIHNDQTRRIAGSAALENEKKEDIFQIAMKNLKHHFAVVGLTEKMDETICLMKQSFGWQGHHLYYPKNVTIDRTDRQAISSELIQVIAEQNELDIRLYSWAEQLLKQVVEEKGTDFQSELQSYKDSIKKFVEQAEEGSMDSTESKKVHQVVLEMIQAQKLR
jgi:hypothetical protein